MTSLLERAEISPHSEKRYNSINQLGIMQWNENHIALLGTTILIIVLKEVVQLHSIHHASLALSLFVNATAFIVLQIGKHTHNRHAEKNDVLEPTLIDHRYTLLLSDHRWLQHVTPAENVDIVDTAVELLVCVIIQWIKHFIGRSNHMEERTTTNSNLLLKVT